MTVGEKKLEEFKAEWVGKNVKIVGLKHPHQGECGNVVSIDWTNVGYGLKVELVNGESCYVFKGQDIKVI